MIHPEVKHKTFSTGKAVAGAVTFGVVGAAAGFIGKDQKGYQCGQCGAFMESPMDFGTELSVNSAIREAERGGNRAMYDYFKSQYGNISANIPMQIQEAAAPAFVPVQADSRLLGIDVNTVTVKQSYRNLSWSPDCPTYIETITVLGGNGNDQLKLLIYNQSKKIIRSAYYQVKVYDDTFDLIDTIKCVYQGIEIMPGQALPVDKQFDLKTDIAYKVEIECEKVAFTDDEVWRGGDETTYVLTEQTELTTENFPRLQYVKRDLSKYSKADADGKLYLPVNAEGYWQCICKKPSLTGETCVNCGAQYHKLEELLSQTRLLEEQKKAVMERAANRAKATEEAYENARRDMYARANELAGNSNLDSVKEAIAIYEKLGDYEESKAKLEYLNTELPAITQKIQEEKAAKEAALAQERAERAAAEQAQKEQEAKEAKQKKNGKYILTVLMWAVNYLLSAIGIFRIITMPFMRMGLPMRPTTAYIISAVITAIGVIIAICIYAAIRKEKIKSGKMIQAACFAFVYSMLMSFVFGRTGAPAAVTLVIGLIVYFIIACIYTAGKSKK